jgi:DHA2 family multidrug resistance protein
VKLATQQGLLLRLGLATSTEFYTSVSVNSVLPVAGASGVPRDQAAWILTTYTSPLLFSLPLSIWMAGRVGYLRNIIGSAIIFAVASVSL